ncbi:MAG: hypothetical protein IKC63_02125 [Clostridia bacterium]|nr:hypothetical protein [Clostridia bacterium]
MIPILRALVLMLFAVFAVKLACRREECRTTYRLILAFVAVGATTFVSEEAFWLQALLGVLTFILLTVVTHITVSHAAQEEKNEGETRQKRDF